MTVGGFDENGLAGLSDATRKRLADAVALLVKWNRAINLVSPGSLEHVWSRHVADSAQLFEHRPKAARSWLDLGSGGGFPGLVIAVLAHELEPDLRVEMVEADQRKCAFLQTAVRDLGLNCTVTRARIEALPARSADVISARALANLDQLCAYALPHLGAGGICLFLKGAALEAEVAQARLSYLFDFVTFPSRTESGGVIARIANLAHV